MLFVTLLMACRNEIDTTKQVEDVEPEVVDADGDGYSVEDGDCDDTDNSIYPGAVDIADNGIDENCDGVDGYIFIVEKELENVIVHPNPASDKIFISGENIVKISIMDLTGKLIMDSKSNEININTLTNGVYVIKVYGAIDQLNFRLLKQ